MGRVIDPAGGAWLVENLTEAMAERAWLLVQEVERLGGMLPALIKGWPQQQVAASRERLEREVACRRALITGVSEFADLGTEAPPEAGNSPPRHGRRVDPANSSVSPRRRIRAGENAWGDACPWWRTADCVPGDPRGSSPVRRSRDLRAQSVRGGWLCRARVWGVGVRRGGRPRVRCERS